MPGVNNSRRIPCSVSVHHGHYPSTENCPMCPAPVVRAWVPPTYPDECLRVTGACFCEECTTDADYWSDYSAFVSGGGKLTGCYNTASDTYNFGGFKYEGLRMRRILYRGGP